MLSVLAFLGLLLARWADALRTFPLSAALLLFPVTYYITHSAVRYRHPIDPIMTILAVYAVSYAYAKLQGRPARRLLSFGSPRRCRRRTLLFGNPAPDPLPRQLAFMASSRRV